MSDDEMFVRRLRERVDAVVPLVDVELDGVIPRARRRRAVRSVASGAVAAALVGAGWVGVAALPGQGSDTDVLAAASTAPAPSTSTPAAPSPASPSAGPELPAPVSPYGAAAYAVSADGEMTGASGDPWEGPDLYWHSASETRHDDGTVVSRREMWQSRERPGIGVDDADLGSAFAMGPSAVLGGYVIDGTVVDMLAEPRYLPTDPDALDAVLRASVAADEAAGAGRGSPDDRVFQRTTELLAWNGALLPADLRDALWQVAAAVPGARSSDGIDPDGRPGHFLNYTFQPSDGGEETIVRDPATGLVIATHYPSTATWMVVTQQGPTSEIPLEPTLEVAGCTMWISC